MLERFRPRLSFANVMSSIAVFLALGGGYAMAFAGSGTLQKGNVTGLTSSNKTVRTLTGIGSIQAVCPSDGNMTLTFNNTSGKTLVVESLKSHEGEFSDADSAGVVNNSPYINNLTASANDYFFHWYIQPALGEPAGSKSPQADIQISAFVDSNCAGSRVAALALNTQQ